MPMSRMKRVFAALGAYAAHRARAFSAEAAERISRLASSWQYDETAAERSLPG